MLPLETSHLHTSFDQVIVQDLIFVALNMMDTYLYSMVRSRIFIPSTDLWHFGLSILIFFACTRNSHASNQFRSSACVGE